MTKALLSAIESEEGLFYEYVLGEYAEFRKGRMRDLRRTTGPETRRKHLAEKFARKQIIYKESLMNTND